ncbi:HIT domain-containing protein [Caldivirga sp. MU80]|uniref:HIT family protein n=1 Tax=Caldivirga sp. MU80 TaxID=1650354 RepID=UPI0008305C19|nr:HIT domain-containing protein [Caldivirga sp. MU80]
MALYTPWRMSYITGAINNRELGCFMCRAVNSDEELVVYRGRYCIALMNKYPYNRGHMLIAPKRHVPGLIDLTDEELMECAVLIKASVCALAELLRPMDFNIGVNIGRVAGAGYEEHVHFHIVPRWSGDTSNIPVDYSLDKVIGDIKGLMPELSRLIARCMGDDSHGPEVHTNEG